MKDQVTWDSPVEHSSRPGRRCWEPNVVRLTRGMTKSLEVADWRPWRCADVAMGMHISDKYRGAMLWRQRYTVPATLNWLIDWLIFIRARNKRTCREQNNNDHESDRTESVRALPASEVMWMWTDVNNFSFLNAVVTCEIKLFQNYFTGLSRLMNFSTWSLSSNNFEIFLEFLQGLK